MTSLKRTHLVCVIVLSTCFLFFNSAEAQFQKKNVPSHILFRDWMPTPLGQSTLTSEEKCFAQSSLKPGFHQIRTLEAEQTLQKSFAQSLIPKKTVVLHFDGAIVFKAQKANPLWHLSPFCQGVIPPFAHEQFGKNRKQVIDQLVELVRKKFEYFNILLTTERPANLPYDLVIIGGRSSICGIPDGYAGIGHLDCQDGTNNDVSFVFSEGINSLEILAVIISHEIGHTLGLLHTMLDCDIMSNFLCPSGEKTFLNLETQPSPDERGKCGLDNVNSWKLLYNALGLSALAIEKVLESIQRLAPILALTQDACGISHKTGYNFAGNDQQQPDGDGEWAPQNGCQFANHGMAHGFLGAILCLVFMCVVFAGYSKIKRSSK